MTENDQAQGDAAKDPSQGYPADKARGCFFAAFESFPYEPRGVILGQYKQDSCVAACCRMLLADQGIELPESDIRAALKVDGGAYISTLPEALRLCGLTIAYQYRNDLTIDDLRLALQRGPAVAFVVRLREKAGHALLIEEITEYRVCLRDPLPELEGQAYQVALIDFLPLWIHSHSGRGKAAVVLE